MIRVSLLVAAFAAGSFTLAADPEAAPAEVKKKAIEWMTKAAEARASLVTQEREAVAILAGAKVGVIDGNVKVVKIPETIDKKNPVRFQNATAKKSFIADQEKKVDGLRYELKKPATKPEHFAPGLELTKVGEIGRISAQKVEVFEVIDKTTGVISTFTVGTGFDFKARRIQVLVSGVDTTGWADRLPIDAPAGVFHVGTKKIDGTTYLHLVPVALTDDEAKKIMDAAKPAK